MTNRIYIFLLFGSILTFIYIIKKIINHKMQIRDAVHWILWTFFLIIISIFPQVVAFFSYIFGIKEDVHTIFLIIMAYLYIMLFIQGSKISKQSEKIKELTQELALFSKENEEKWDDLTMWRFFEWRLQLQEQDMLDYQMRYY